jgi:hypothetical protein
MKRGTKDGLVGLTLAVALTALITIREWRKGEPSPPRGTYR